MGLTTFLVTVLLAAGVVLAEDEHYPKVTWSGWGWWSQGQVMRSAYLAYDRFDTTSANNYASSYQYYDFNHVWLMDADAGIRVSAQVSPRSVVCVHPGIGIRFQSVQQKNANMGDAKDFRGDPRPYLIEASLDSRLVDRERLKLNLKLGYFTEKYNPQVRNLGEYLLRSSAYPQILVSGFELADKAKILGVRAKLSLLDMVDHEFLVISESQMYPLYDLSLGYIVDFHPHPFVSLGAGVEFSRLISVDEHRTTPGTNKEAISGATDRFYSMNISDAGDTTLYTFRGVKTMARLTLDPKAFLKTGIFGDEDLKLYSECAILGVKNFPGFYEERTERMPVMFGFNLPAFRVLDVLALECEWFGSEYANSLANIWDHSSPVPNPGLVAGSQPQPGENNYPFKDDDNRKWSLYASKKVTNFLRLSLQFANDHTQRVQYMTGYFKVHEELCQRPQDWYWMLRVNFMF